MLSKNWLLSISLATLAMGFQMQMPFDTSRFQDWLPLNGNSYRHYLTVPLDQLPIDVHQYKNDMVIRINYAENKELKKLLFSLQPENKPEDSNNHKDTKIHYSRWAHNNVKSTVDLQIDEDNLVGLIGRFPLLDYTVIIQDLAQKVYETYPQDFERPGKSKIYAQKDDYVYKSTAEVLDSMKVDVMSELFFREYRPLETIDAWLDIIQQTYPDIITLEEIGHSFENRAYKVVHFSVPDGNVDHSQKKTIVVNGGVHSREWISVSSVLYTVYQLIQLYNENPTSKIFSHLDFLFIPISNPDGYEYTWRSDRLWRKNRQLTLYPGCFGIDIDHSYDYHWIKSSDWACGEEYSGEQPFEAYESQIWEDYLNATNNDHKIWGYIDLHSYAQEILYPYAYSCSEQPRDEENLIELAYGISKAIRVQSGKTYDVLPACIDKDADLLPDLGSGSALDFMYHNRAYWAYQLKLRDSGSHGFLLPSKYIEPVGEEIFAGIKYFCLFILSDDR